MTDRELSSIFAEIELKLIASLKRNLKTHKEWESDLSFDWPAWQAQKIKHLERFRKENKSIMKEYRKVINDETRKMLIEQYAEGQQEVEKELREYLSAEISDDSFFRVFYEKLESLIEEIQGKERTIETAALRMTDDVYRQTILKSDIALQTGSMTVPQAIEQAVRDFALKGINCIEYKNGRRVNIASYVEMALRTSNKRAQLLGAAKKRAELGFDTVRVSSYNMCSPTCLPWQGKAYIDDVFGMWDGEQYGNMGKSKDGHWYLLLSVAIENGLFHPNCRHIITSYDVNGRVVSAEDDEEINRRYKLEQKQRKLERDVRKWKRAVEGTDNPIFKDAYKKKVRDAQKKLREFIDENDKILRRDYSREKVYNFKSTVSGRSAGANEETENNLPKLVGKVDFSDKDAIINVLNEKMNEAKKYDYEVDRTVTSDGFVWDTIGTSATVNPSLIESYGSSLKGSYSYHNHPPEETHYSFSAEDVSFFVSFENKHNKSSDHLYEYEMISTNDTLFSDYDTVKNDFKEFYRNTVLEMSMNGEIDIDLDGYHEAMKFMSEKYHFIYHRRKKDD